MEDNRAGVVLSAIDFSKAFNRLDHKKCLEVCNKKGSSPEIQAIIGSFLCSRRMTVRIGTTMSRMRPVNAGAPQGSVLGCYLFNVGVDDLEDDFNYSLHEERQEEAHQETLTR